MNSMDDTGVVARPESGRTSYTHRLRGLAGTGFVASLASMVGTTLAAALAQAVGVDVDVDVMAAGGARVDGQPPGPALEILSGGPEARSRQEAAHRRGGSRARADRARHARDRAAAPAPGLARPAGSRHDRLGRPVHRPLRHRLGHHAQLRRDRRHQRDQPRRRRTRDSRGLCCRGTARASRVFIDRPAP